MKVVRPQAEGADEPDAVLFQQRLYRGENVARHFHAGIEHHDGSPQALLQDDVLGGGFAQIVVGVYDARAGVFRRQLVKPFARAVRGAVVENHRLDVAPIRPLQRAVYDALHVVRPVARHDSDCEVEGARRVYQRGRFGGGRDHVARFGQLLPRRLGADARAAGVILHDPADFVQRVSDGVGGGVLAGVAQARAGEQLL